MKDYIQTDFRVTLSAKQCRRASQV